MGGNVCWGFFPSGSSVLMRHILNKSFPSSPVIRTRETPKPAETFINSRSHYFCIMFEYYSKRNKTLAVIWDKGVVFYYSERDIQLVKLLFCTSWVPVYKAFFRKKNPNLLDIGMQCLGVKKQFTTGLQNCYLTILQFALTNAEKLIGAWLYKIILAYHLWTHY